MPLRFFVSVGEVSGDNHAAGLIKAVRQIDSSVVIYGIGGPAMQAAGAVIHHETTRHAAMTLHGLKRVGELKRLERWLAGRYASQDKPDLHICVDSSGFNLRFAALAKQFGVPTLYYVAPQLWASRPGRIVQMRACVDRLACIFPFEQEWFGQRGVNATFVGHPLFDALPDDRLARMKKIVAFGADTERIDTKMDSDSDSDRDSDRDSDIESSGDRSDGSPTIGIVAGSRLSEVRANLPGLLKAMALIQGAFAGVKFLLPTTPAGHEFSREQVRQCCPDLHVEVAENAFDRLIPLCDLVLCKSGTSTVHVAAYGVPMIVVYRINTLLWKSAGQFLVKTPKIAMVNILAGQREIVPELIPWNGDPKPVAEHAIDLLRDGRQRAAMRAELLALMATLDKKGASMNVARLALEMVGQFARE